VSSNEEPFSPPVSEYLPSSSPSPTTDLGNTLPSSMLNDFDFSLRDCLGNDTLFSTPTSTTRNNLIFIASPTVVFISNSQKTIAMGNKDSYENLAVSSGNYIEGINPLPNDADLEPVSRSLYNATLPEKSITAAEPETEPTSTSPDRPPPVHTLSIEIVPHSDPPVIACHVETLPAGHNSTTEPEATTSRPVLVTEANTNPRKRKRNPDQWSKTQKKKKYRSTASKTDARVLQM
jgi:hypothetical protein